MRTLASLVLLPLALLTGCARAPHVTAPDDFAALDGDGPFAFRATNASGVVLGVRTEKNEPRGNLDFWAQALHHKLTKAGYRHAGSSALTTEAGVAGKRLTYEIDRGGRVQEYWLTVFVAGDRVIVVEAGGDTAFFDDKTEARVLAAIKTLSLG